MFKENLYYSWKTTGSIFKVLFVGETKAFIRYFGQNNNCYREEAVLLTDYQHCFVETSYNNK